MSKRVVSTYAWSAFVLPLACLLAVLGETGPAAAQSAPRSDGLAETGSLYARLSAGAVFPNRLVQDVLVPQSGLVSLEGPVTERETTFGAGVQAGAAIGFAFPDGTRTELEYRYAGPSVDSVVERNDGSLEQPRIADDSVGVHYLMSNVYFDFDMGGPIVPFVGGGVGGAFVENGLGDSDAAFAYQGRAGLAAELGPALMFDVEYVYNRTRALIFGPNDPNNTTPNGTFGGDPLATSSVMASIRKTF
ncbi:MAG: P44/Msp2 family outer membrane protein [Pseudomonadota bacterium]